MIRQKNQKGFTIVELVVAIIVGTIFILALGSSVNSYTHTGQDLRDFATASAYVESKVEALRNSGYNSLAIGSTNLTSELPSELKSPRSATMVVSQPYSGIKQVDLSVTYNDLGNSRNYQYTTYIGELGVGQ